MKLQSDQPRMALMAQISPEQAQREGMRAGDDEVGNSRPRYRSRPSAKPLSAKRSQETITTKYYHTYVHTCSLWPPRRPSRRKRRLKLAPANENPGVVVRALAALAALAQITQEKA